MQLLDNDLINVLAIINNDKDKMFIYPLDQHIQIESWLKIFENLIGNQKNNLKNNKQSSGGGGGSGSGTGTDGNGNNIDKIEKEIKMTNQETQTEIQSFLSDQKYLSTKEEFLNLKSQLKIMNNSFMISKKEEERLSIRMSELVKYVTQMKSEENNRLDAIQQRVRSIERIFNF